MRNLLPDFSARESFDLPDLLGFTLVLSMVFFLGWGFGRDGSEKETMDWALKVTRECELAYKDDEYSRVSDCLKQAILDVEEAKHEAAKEDALANQR